MKLRGGVLRANKESENTSQWQREPKSTIPQWSVESNAKIRSKNKSIEKKSSSVGNFFGSHFGVRLLWRVVFFGSRCHCKVFSDSLLVRTVARDFFKGVSPPLSSGSAQRARHCGLS